MNESKLYCLVIHTWGFSYNKKSKEVVARTAVTSRMWYDWPRHMERLLGNVKVSFLTWILVTSVLT